MLDFFFSNFTSISEYLHNSSIQTYILGCGSRGASKKKFRLPASPEIGGANTAPTTGKDPRRRGVNNKQAGRHAWRHDSMTRAPLRATPGYALRHSAAPTQGRGRTPAETKDVGDGPQNGTSSE